MPLLDAPMVEKHDKVPTGVLLSGENVLLCMQLVPFFIFFTSVPESSVYVDVCHLRNVATRQACADAKRETR